MYSRISYYRYLKLSITLISLLLFFEIMTAASAWSQFTLDASNKVEPALLQEMDLRGPAESIKVGVWLRQGYDPNEDILRYHGALSDEGRETVVAEAQGKISDTEQPFVGWAAAQGLTVLYRCRYAPLVFVEMSGQTILTAAGRIDVDRIYLSRVYEDEMEHAEKSVRADVVWARGINGSGMLFPLVAVVENNRAEFTNPYLTHLGQPNANIFDPGGAPDAHATSTHGIIAAHRDNDRYRGVAYGTGAILSANAEDYNDFSVIEASEWAKDKGAAIFSCSFGTGSTLALTVLDRYYDYLVRNFYITVIKSAGNRGLTDGNVTSPGLGYNVITVGSFRSNSNNRWNDDMISTFSSFRPSPGNPAGQGRQKPELVAVGEDEPGGIDRLNLAGIANQGPGTSFAAPAVAGAALLLAERRLELLTYVLAMKAILMASACHNIEGDERLSDSDGAGGLVVCEADEVAANQQYHHTNLIAGDLDPHYALTINLEADKVARVVLCWFSNPSRQQITGTWDTLTATRLVDNSKPFGAADSKNDWFLQPDTNSALTYQVTDSDSSWLVVTGGDMTTGTAGSSYVLFQNPDDSLDADLYLKIWDNTGGAYVWQDSSDTANNYEIARFTPPNTGTYEIRVCQTRWDGTVEPIGIAWAQEPCCEPDWGDAPDSMLHCPTRPERGDFPTMRVSDAANVRELEVEWLSQDNTTFPGATWEMDAYVDPFQIEKDQDSVDNINPPLCIPDRDREDDGVLPDPIYIAGTRGRVTFWVNSATPTIGRYSSARVDEKIYVSGWFDWEHDDVTWDGNLEVHWVGGPNMVGVMDVGTCIEGCDMWDSTQHQKRVIAEFDVPQFLPVGPFWIRFRMDYGENVVSETDTATYGEVEDHLSYQTWWLIQDFGTLTYHWEGFSMGDAVAKYFKPPVYFPDGDVIYPYQIHDVSFYLYDFAETGSAEIRIGVYSASQDTCDGPGTPIYLSDVTSIDTFYPDMVHLQLPEPVCVWGAFYIGIEYAGGATGGIPSLLFDSEDYPCDDCHAWVYYASTTDPSWIEWWDFWGDVVPGCPTIRVAGINEHQDCMGGVCGDCNRDSLVTIADVVYTVNYVLRGGHPPEPVCLGDASCDGVVDVVDAVYTVNYLFRGGDPPCTYCCEVEAALKKSHDQKMEGALPRIKPVPRKVPETTGGSKQIE